MNTLWWLFTVGVGIICIFWIYVISNAYIKTRHDNDASVLLAGTTKISGKYTHIKTLKKKDNDLIQKIFKSASVKNKGIGMEYLMAMRGWAPFLNSESIDGHRWNVMKKLIIHLLPICDYNNFENIIIENFEQLLNDNKNVFDHIVCTKLIISSNFQLLFQERLSKNDLNDLFEFVEYMRAVVAAKTYNYMKYKTKWVTKLMNMIKNNKLLSAFLTEFEDENQALFDSLNSKFEKEIIIVSAIFQPFIISPGINWSDIFGPMFYRIFDDAQNKNNKNSTVLTEMIANINENNTQYIDGLLYETLRLYHPFPIIERDIEQDFYIKNKLIFKKKNK
eukprot:90859_1